MKADPKIDPCTQRLFEHWIGICFGHWNLCDSNLFRISDFGALEYWLKIGCLYIVPQHSITPRSRL